MSCRVVVTGMAATTSLGDNWDKVQASLRRYQNRVVKNEEWEDYGDLRSRLASPILDFQTPEGYSRKVLRSMGRVALLATSTAERALETAGLRNEPSIKDGRMGVAFGSSTGSPKALADFTRMLLSKSMRGITANTYLRMMPHTAPVNIGVFLGLTGRVVTTCSACTSGSQAIGYAYEAIKFGKQKLMITGGAEELDVSQVGIFDTLFATSTSNQQPKSTPRPFDRRRDGLVLGEGAGAFVLEDLDHARARGATIYAELVGFHTNSDGVHITQPNPSTMRLCLEGALEDAQIRPEQVGYVNAHGTATERGDVAEAAATAAVFGKKLPISSLKSYIGHTLGACGAIEAWLTIMMMNHDWYAPTLNLEDLDDQCAELDYIVGEGRGMQNEFVMSNNFAFGGINTSLVFKRWSENS